MKLKKRTAIIVGAAVLLLVTVGLAAATIIPSAEDLLTGSLETLESISSGHAVVEVNATLPEQDISGKVEVWGKLDAGANGEPAVRLVVLEASEGEFAGLTFISDGSQFWLYSPDRNSVIVGQAEELAPLLAERMAEYEGQWEHGGDFDPESVDHPETPAEAIAKLLEYVTAERNGSGQIGENEANIVRLVPIAEMMPDEVRLAGGFVNLWLRSDDQLPLAVEYAEGAAGYFKVEASQIQINEPMDSDLFAFAIPAGAEVVEATELLAHMDALNESNIVDEAELLTPVELPEDAEALGTEQFGGTAVQRFTLPDGQSFVIAQGASIPQEIPAEATSSETVSVRGVEGRVHTNEDASRTLLVWQENGLFLMVGGDLSPEQALIIAESLQ